MASINLGEIADIITGPFGSMLHKSDYRETGIPVIMPQDIGDRTLSLDSIARIGKQDAERLARYVTVENDIVYARRGDVEKHAFITADEAGALCGTGCLRVRVDERKADPLFVSFYLNRPESRMWIRLHAVGSNMPNINTDILSELPMELPDLEVQRKVGNLLRFIDAKIANNEKLMAELEDTVRLIYDYWFTQFDFPDENGRPYRSSGGKMIYNEKLRRSIPIDWNVDLLLAHIKWIGGSQPPKSEFKYVPAEGYIRFIQNRDYASDDNRTFIPVRKSNKVCDRQDIMMDKYGDAGKTRYGLAGAYNVALSKIHVPKREEREYVRYFLSSNEIYSYLHASCIASTRASLNEENFGGILLVVPSVNVLHQFDCLASCILEKSLQLMDESQALEGMRNWLLPMLMNGQLVVE